MRAMGRAGALRSEPTTSDRGVRPAPRRESERTNARESRVTLRCTRRCGRDRSKRAVEACAARRHWTSVTHPERQRAPVADPPRSERVNPLLTRPKERFSSFSPCPRGYLRALRVPALWSLPNESRRSRPFTHSTVNTFHQSSRPSRAPNDTCFPSALKAGGPTSSKGGLFVLPDDDVPLASRARGIGEALAIGGEDRLADSSGRGRPSSPRSSRTNRPPPRPESPVSVTATKGSAVAPTLAA